MYSAKFQNLALRVIIQLPRCFIENNQKNHKGYFKMKKVPLIIEEIILCLKAMRNEIDLQLKFSEHLENTMFENSTGINLVRETNFTTIIAVRRTLIFRISAIHHHSKYPKYLSISCADRAAIQKLDLFSPSYRQPMLFTFVT